MEVILEWFKDKFNFAWSLFDARITVNDEYHFSWSHAFNYPVFGE
jgi:hypothetical protein